MPISKLASVGACALLLTLPAFASTIVNTGVGSDGPAVYAMQFEDQGWTQTQTYTNVEISVALFSWTPGVAFTGTAYLTNTLGPSAGSALASSDYSGLTPNSTPEMFTLFTGLTLGPGTYYLTLASTDDEGPQPGAIWNTECASCKLVLDSGVSLLPQNFTNASSVNSSYPPASIFTVSSPPLNLTVTGDAPLTLMPEPAAWLLVPAGFAFTAFLRRATRSR